MTPRADASRTARRAREALTWDGSLVEFDDAGRISSRRALPPGEFSQVAQRLKSVLAAQTPGGDALTSDPLWGDTLEDVLQALDAMVPRQLRQSDDARATPPLGDLC